MYCATIPTGSLPPPSTTVTASADASVVGSADSSVAVPWEACAVAVEVGAAFSVLVDPLRETTISAINTTATTTAITTRFDEDSEGAFLFAEGRLAPGVFAGRLTTEVLWWLERLVDTAGTTKVEEAFLATFFVVRFATFLTVFLAALFLTADFLTVFFTALFFAVFLAEVFLAVFLTATVVLLGL